MASGQPRVRLASGRTRLALVAAFVVLTAAVAIAAAGGGPPPLPLPGTRHVPRGGDPFGYVAAHESAFVARATAGSAHPLYVQSPDGVRATAARVGALRGLLDAATAGTNIDPNTLEAIALLESAGRPDAIASGDPAAASGLTQILAQTGQSLLAMHIDLARSRRLTQAINVAESHGQSARVAQLERQRARVDDRFDPRKALAATVRYLELAQRRFGRADLAVVSYHMGIGNLQQVLDDYNGGHPVPYSQLYFDTSLDRHAAAYRLLSGFGDDSWTYYWRVLAATQIMHLYRTDPAALQRQISLQGAADSGAEVLQPAERVHQFSDPDALASAYAAREVIRLPTNAPALGLSYDPAMGALAHRLGASAALYRGLRPAALDLLIELAARVRALSGGAAPLTVGSTVVDKRYLGMLGFKDPPAAAGWSFMLARRYVSHAQALALQAMLDRLQALDLIAWVRYPDVIEVTVSSDASRVIESGI